MQRLQSAVNPQGWQSRATQASLRAMRLLTLAALSLALCVTHCAKEDSATGATATDIGAADGTTGNSSVDIPVIEPCVGIKPDKKAEQFNDACAGVDKCTQLVPDTSKCHCTFCGPVANKIVCLQSGCPTPGGG